MNDSDFLPADWPVPSGVKAGTTLRTGGVGEGAFASLNLAAHVGDEPAAVRANRTRLRRFLALPDEPVWLRQVHGTRVVKAAAGARDSEADAAWTDEPGVVCAVMTADCLPVVFASRDGRVVAAAHAGWRGLCQGVLESTVEALPADPAELHAWFGPGISQAAFEVGDEVRAQFLALGAEGRRCFERNGRGRWQADLYGLARLRLEAAGIAGIHGGGMCTAADARRFFSYRRDGPCGRMATLVWRRPIGGNA